MALGWPVQDRVTRINPDQVKCKILGCEKVACFVVYHVSADEQAVVDPYCEDHVEPIAHDLGIEIPERRWII
jgi:hypothetical protein